MNGSQNGEGSMFIIDITCFFGKQNLRLHISVSTNISVFTNISVTAVVYETPLSRDMTVYHTPSSHNSEVYPGMYDNFFTASWWCVFYTAELQFCSVRCTANLQLSAVWNIAENTFLRISPGLIGLGESVWWKKTNLEKSRDTVHQYSETLYWLNLLSEDNKSPSDQTSRLLHFTRDSLVLLKHSLKGPKVCISPKTEASSLANAPYMFLLWSWIPTNLV